MIRKSLATSLILSSYLFSQPCFSMWCCCSDDEEKKTLMGTPVVSTAPVAVEVIEDQRLRHVSKTQEPEIQQIIQGSITLSCPNDLRNHLSITRGGDSCTSIVYKQIFNIQVFVNYDDGLSNNAFKQIDKSKPPSSTASLNQKIRLFSKDVEKKVSEEDLPVASQIMQMIQDQLVEKIAYTDVKFGQDTTTSKCGIIFKMNEGAVFLEGPGKK